MPSEEKRARIGTALGEAGAGATVLPEALAEVAAKLRAELAR